MSQLDDDEATNQGDVGPSPGMQSMLAQLELRPHQLHRLAEVR